MEDEQVHQRLSWWGHASIDFRHDEQVHRVRRWQRAYGDLFRHLREDPRINTQGDAAHVENLWFPTPDAEAYAAIIGDVRPERIVEVGGGFSTRIGRAAASWHGLATRITVIDPDPKTDVGDDADEVILKSADDIPLAEMQLTSGDILFIDSSHRAAPERDVAHLFTRVIPALPAGAVVHVHDVFLPYEYKPRFLELHFSEQFLLAALLAHTPRYRTLLAVRYLAASEPELMREALGWTPEAHGGSFWFSVEG